MKTLYALAFAAVILCGAAYGQDAGTGNGFFDGVWYPSIRAGADIGFTNELDGVAMGDTTYDEDLHGTTDWIVQKLYDFNAPGHGFAVQAGIEGEFLSLWQGKGMVGAEAYVMGGYLGGGEISQFEVGIGIGGTLFWVGKYLFEIGYSGMLSPIDMPVAYSGSYTYSAQTPGGLFIGIDLGLEVPVFIVPNLSAFIFYRFFQTLLSGPLGPTDPNDYGYWETRNGLRAGFSYRIGEGEPISVF
jgi:hypothetical protein